MNRDALGAHSRGELGITQAQRARPLQAALVSAFSFVVGANNPITSALLAPSARVVEVSFATALITLSILGGTAAYAGGASLAAGAFRVAFWGALAMGITAGVGKLFGASI